MVIEEVQCFLSYMEGLEHLFVLYIIITLKGKIHGYHEKATKMPS